MERIGYIIGAGDLPVTHHEQACQHHDPSNVMGGKRQRKTKLQPAVKLGS